jgi:NADH kinase
VILEPATAHFLHHNFSFPIYTLPPSNSSTPFPYTQSTYPRTPQLNPVQVAPTSPAAQPGHGESLYHQKTDLLITLGGDGTILHAASMFSTSKRVPPVLSFAMGTLGFLGEWRWEEHAEAIGEVMTGARVLRRGRLMVGVYDRNGKRVGGEWGEYEGIGGLCGSCSRSE